MERAVASAKADTEALVEAERSRIANDLARAHADTERLQAERDEASKLAEEAEARARARADEFVEDATRQKAKAARAEIEALAQQKKKADTAAKIAEERLAEFQRATAIVSNLETQAKAVVSVSRDTLPGMVQVMLVLEAINGIPDDGTASLIRRIGATAEKLRIAADAVTTTKLEVVAEVVTGEVLQ